MLTDFLEFIDTQQLFTTEDYILLTVSGGIDSVVMLHLFSQSPYKFAVAHANFQLRGEEANGDEAFVRDLAARVGVPFFSKRFATREYQQQHRLSTQMAARELRYAWFSELIKAEKFTHLAVAHHQNDLLETVLLNLIRGTGIAGVRGFLPKKNKRVRPLWWATRTQIRQYAAEQHLQWREDYSNHENKYRRNMLRNQIIPELRKINPALEANFKHTAHRLQAADIWLQQGVRLLQSRAIRRDKYAVYIGAQWVDKLPAAEVLFAEVLKKYQFSYTQAQQIFAARGRVGAIFHSSTHSIGWDRAQWVIVPHTTDTAAYNIHKGDSEVYTLQYALKISQHLPHELDYQAAAPHEAYFDADRLQFPLTLRLWQEGDSIAPIGMSGRRQKLSDVLIDAKVPHLLKGRVWVLVSGEEIVWVLGYKVSEHFKITSSTQQLLKVVMQ